MQTKLSARKLLFIVILGILFHWMLNNLSFLWEIVSQLLRVFRPLIAGLVITIILSVLVDLFEDHVFTYKAGKPRYLRWRRPLAVISSILSFLLLFFLIGFVLLPRLAQTIQGLSSQLPHLITNVVQRLEKLVETFPILQQWLDPESLQVEELFQRILKLLSGIIPSTLNATMQITGSIISFFYTTLLGLVFAIYFLLQREKIMQAILRVLYAYSNHRFTQRFTKVFALLSKSFKLFVTGQFIEVLINGLLVYIGMALLGLPEKLLISFIMGVTAVIPMFGALFGTILGGLLLLIINPIQAIIFVILAIVINQVDGNIIYPRLVGNQMGTPSLIILAAVIIGGNIAGFTGMILAVPLSSVIYPLLTKNIQRRVSQKKALQTLQKEDLKEEP